MPACDSRRRTAGSPRRARCETIFVAGRCFPEIKGAPDFKALVPRVSAVYDLFGDGRTAIKFSASRYDQPITLQNVLRLNPLGATNDTRVWTTCAGGKTSLAISTATSFRS